jgi:hypothetical protein
MFVSILHPKIDLEKKNQQTRTRKVLLNEMHTDSFRMSDFADRAFQVIRIYDLKGIRAAAPRGSSPEGHDTLGDF